MIATREERLEAENADLRKVRDEQSAEKAALEQIIAQALAILAAPVNGEEADVAAFGRGAWVYCSQHMRAHQTGWCSVDPRDKVALGVADAKAAIEKCRAWGFELYSDKYPNG